MKKVLLNALFIGLATLGFAQTTFTEATFKDMMQRYQKQTVEFLKTETTSDFLFIGVSGESMDQEPFITFVQGASEFTNMTIRQYDNTAIVTGIWSHSHRLKFNNSIVSYKEAVTETFVRQNGKWLYASHQGGFAPTVQADEEAAIKKLLVDERNAFHAGDKDGMAKFWTNNAHTFVNASYPNGNQFYMDNDRVQKSISNFKPNDNSVGTITSSKVKVYGNNAVADLEQTTTHKNGSVHKEHNIVLLEKEADAWKVSGYSVHGLSKDKQEDSAAIVKVIEKETQSWHNRDADGRIACIANVPYALMLVHHGNMASNNGVAYVTNEKTNAPEAMKAQMASMGKPNGTTFKNENYAVTIKGGTAFVSYTEIATATDGTKQHIHAVRNLEKIEGLWKLTYIGGVVYKPTTN
jgi:ketosteroid isomerase-like protein